MGVKLDLTLREEHRLRVLVNRVLRRMFWPTREEVGEGCTVRSFMTCMFSQILLDDQIKDEISGSCGQKVW